MISPRRFMFRPQFYPRLDSLIGIVIASNSFCPSALAAITTATTFDPGQIETLLRQSPRRLVAGDQRSRGGVLEAESR
jgi:hypothetical protein